MKMKKKLTLTIIILTLVAGSMACSNVNSQSDEYTTAVENNSVEVVDSMDSGDGVAEAVTEATSVEATEETSQTLTDEDREKMHAMLDATGYIDGNAYENGFFNVRFDLDESYTFSDAEELKELNGIDIDFNNDPMVTSAISDGNLVMVAQASDKTDTSPANNIFDVMIQGVDLEVGLSGNEEAFLEEFKSSVLSSLPNATAEIENIIFLGKDHPSLFIKANVNGVDIYKRYVCQFKPQFVSIYSVTGRDADTFDEVIRKAEMIR